MPSMSIFRPLVLYCHGLGASPNNRFAQQLRCLVESRKLSFQSVQYRHVGANKLWDVNEWLKDILSCIDNAKSKGFSSNILIGFSGGCHAVLRATIERPDDISGLLLLAPGVGLSVQSYVAATMPHLADELYRGEAVLIPALKDGFPVLLNRRCLEEYAEKCVSNSMTRIPIKCPVRVLLGGDDKVSY
uniref:Hydrolase_4 domain-containing protein n=1 Tax=Syphacia muris TaxID=451379 RepID=A0A0N5AE88_9BILA